MTTETIDNTPFYERLTFLLPAMIAGCVAAATFPVWGYDDPVSDKTLQRTMNDSLCMQEKLMGFMDNGRVITRRVIYQSSLKCEREATAKQQRAAVNR